MKKVDVVVFSDLDGTLLDENYDFKNARQGLDILKNNEIPLIICTSKTRHEIEFYRRKIKNNHPFISENGGAIFIPKNYFKFKFKYNKEIEDYYVIELGTGYEKLIKIMREIEKKLCNRGNVKVVSFNDMKTGDLVKDSGLNKREAQLAMKREYDEAFKIFGNKKEVLKEIKRRKLSYTSGGKYYHILGNNDKGKAIKILEKLYEKDYGKIKTVALGDSRNDKEMLESVNRAFLLQKPDKSYAKIENKKITRARGVSSEGWNNAILDLFWHLKSEKAEEIYRESISVLKKLQLRNGAIFASSPKGRYPYVYPRDYAICILALIDSKLMKKAKKSLEFIFKSQNKDGSFPQRLSKNGKDKSYKPIQLDNTGLILIAFARYIKETGDKTFLLQQKEKVKKSINYLKSQLHEKNLFFTPNSIHEFPPYEEGLEVWVNAICCGAIKELEDIKIKTGINIHKIKRSIGKYLWNGKYFVKNIRLGASSSVQEDIDACSYALADYGLFRDSNNKIKKTVSEIEKVLWHKKIGGICRYKKNIGRNNGGWGPWPHFTLMICRHFIRLGEKKRAEKYLGWVLEIAYKNQLPEHVAEKEEFDEWVDSFKSAGILRKDRQKMISNIRRSKSWKEKGLAYSVLPLAWPHAEFILTWNLYKKKFG